MRRTLAVMAKAPIPAAVKTRLCPPLSLPIAARLHEQFILDVFEKASMVPDAELVVCYTPAAALSFFREAAPDAAGYILQKGENIGERMSHCFELLCEPGRSVAVIGTDSPTLPARYLELAFDVLTSGQVGVVFGPSGGGCYLVGANSHCPELFRDIGRSSEEILEQSVERAAGLGLGWYLLPGWYGVDHPADLARLRSELLGAGVVNSSAPRTAEFLRQHAEAG